MRRARGTIAAAGGLFLALLAGGCEDPPGRQAPRSPLPADSSPDHAVAAPAINSMNQGLALLRQGRVAEAVAALRQARLARPADAVLAYYLAEALFADTKIGEAEALFTEATRLDPGQGQAWLRLSSIMLEQGRLEDALQVVKRMETRRGGGPSLDYQEGFILSKLGRDAEAEAALRRSLAVRSGNADAWYVLGLNHQRHGRDSDAVNAFRRALEVDPAYADAWFNLGNALARRGDTAEAVQALERFDSVNVQREAALARAATLQSLKTGAEMALDGGRGDDAGRQLDAAEALLPGAPWVERLRGEICLDRDDIEEALGHLRRAAARPPGEPAEQLALAAAFRRAGDAPAASRHEEIARQLLGGSRGGTR